MLCAYYNNDETLAKLIPYVQMISQACEWVNLSNAVASACKLLLPTLKPPTDVAKTATYILTRNCGVIEHLFFGCLAKIKQKLLGDLDKLNAAFGENQEVCTAFVNKLLHSDEAAAELTFDWEKPVGADFEAILDSANHADFSLEVGNDPHVERLACHKPILVARWPWFQRLIHSGLRESVQGNSPNLQSFRINHPQFLSPRRAKDQKPVGGHWDVINCCKKPSSVSVHWEAELIQ